MNINFIISKLKEQFKYIEQKGQSIIFSNIKYDSGLLEPSFECNNSGVFVYERNMPKKIIDTGNINLNLVGIYCLMQNSQKINRNDFISILNASSIEEIKKIFFAYVPAEYCSKNFTINSNELQNDKLNVLQTETGYEIWLKKGNYACIMALSPKEENDMYAALLEALISKKDFEDNVLKNLSLADFTEKDILNMYCIFKHKETKKILEIEKKNKQL